MEKKFSLKKSVWNDYALCFSLAISVVFLIAAFAYAWKESLFVSISHGYYPRNLIVMVAVLVVFAICGLIAFKKRIDFIKSFEEVNTSVDAEIVSHYSLKKRFRVKIKYSYNGIDYEKSVELNRNSATSKLINEPKVKILIDQEYPEKPLIPELYFED